MFIILGPIKGSATEDRLAGGLRWVSIISFHSIDEDFVSDHGFWLIGTDFVYFGVFRFLDPPIINGRRLDSRPIGF